MAPTQVNSLFNAMKAASEDVSAVRSQAFFAELANDIRAPHTGDAHRATVQGILQRAQAAGLFTPEES